MCAPGRHCLIWTWLAGMFVLACITEGCTYVVRERKG